MANDPGEVPAHVPAELVFDFDYFDPPGGEMDLPLAWKRLQDTAPRIFWTPRNGGHWVATAGEDIREIQVNYRQFSQRVIGIPANRASFKLLPVNLDPPEHMPYRRLIVPAFSVPAIKSLEPSIRAMAGELIAGIASRGECEFIADFAKKMPIGIFLKIVDLPYADREMLLSLSQASSRSRDLSKAHEAQAQMKSYLQRWVNERRNNPGEDLISQVVHAKIDGQPLSVDDIFNLLTVVLFGGLDTVTSLLGFVCRFLAQNPGHRKQLCECPDVREAAVEELIRRHGIVNTARYITGDVVFKGVELKEGELIQIPNLLYGLDDSINADPLKVDFHRHPVRHVAFGTGPHACPGAFLARREVAAFIDGWLEAIPDFAVKPGTVPRMAPGPVNGVAELFLSWDQTTHS